MKRTERHHLKQNELATSVAHARERFEQNRTQLVFAGAALVIAVVASVGYITWRSRTNDQAGEMLAKAMIVLDAPVTPAPAPNATTPPPPPQPGAYPTERAKLEAALPKFLAAADAYPSTQAGIAARYHAAAILAMLGRTADAEKRYSEVIKRRSGIYAEMARLGLADTQSRAGKHDAAIRTWKEITERKNGELPIDGVLMQLARTYQAAGKQADARQAFKRIVDEFPQSPYAADAKQELETLTASAAPKN